MNARKSAWRARVYNFHVNYAMRLRQLSNSLRKAAGASRNALDGAPMLEAAATRNSPGERHKKAKCDPSYSPLGQGLQRPSLPKQNVLLYSRINGIRFLCIAHNSAQLSKISRLIF
jgi:hypothetical protein